MLHINFIFNVELSSHPFFSLSIKQLTFFFCILLYFCYYDRNTKTAQAIVIACLLYIYYIQGKNRNHTNGLMLFYEPPLFELEEKKFYFIVWFEIKFFSIPPDAFDHQASPIHIFKQNFFIYFKFASVCCYVMVTLKIIIEWKSIIQFLDKLQIWSSY